MASNNESFGSIGVSLGLISLPYLPTIVTEWAALIPLAIHLASYQDDYITTGNISLLGRLPASLFPALGTFSNIARFLERDPEYLDYASTKGGLGQKAWDVNWGSTFPVANGAASASIISFLLKKRRLPIMNIHAWITPSNLPAASSRSTQVQKRREDTYRPQILNIYNFRRVDKRRQRRSPFRHVLNQLGELRLFRALLFIGLLALAVFFVLSGAFGTAAVVFIRVVCEVYIHSIAIRRPLGYLENNETHDAFMLVAAHENAMEWHLYTGDRGIVDTLLNKPMIMLPEGRGAYIAATWFRCAHICQLMAMTFVAAQKGWDGVCLIFLLIAHYGLTWLFNRKALASNWMEREHAEAEAGRFEFSGRHGIIGAIQLLSGTKINNWMDDILVPHPRRDFWLESLMLPEGKTLQYPAGFNEHDKKKVERDVATARKAVMVIKQCMPGSTAIA
ncbi:uncharacterized protein F4817DRAFT_154788 [Daldinia loculata]|uniref:uncharacterized protein n=1 Tax=Daldinia loculata TaxID=103429 RepID=UPI0020C39B99|nr:uncharacterized protein F4817DRAFT_154788 [Daldinia loculata]KAI1646008.1 hypothetical protein F4817DRAFT_154788 [Daldinia loculata]